MFCFDLRPVDEIEPWTGADGLCLSWFGLSDGWYFIDAAGHHLLEYAAGAACVSYQVARLHEDVLQMMPDVLEAVPESLVARFTNGSLLATYRVLLATANELSLDDPLWDALEGFRFRCLDTLYLNPGANIAFWRRNDDVVIEWDNRSYVIAGERAWTATQGRVSLCVEDFKSAVADFHERFMSAMRTRIDDVTSHWSRAEVRQDPSSLREDQTYHEGLLEPALRMPSRRTIRWDAAVAARVDEDR
jgi:hypothetical protein